MELVWVKILAISVGKNYLELVWGKYLELVWGKILGISVGKTYLELVRGKNTWN